MCERGCSRKIASRRRFESERERKLLSKKTLWECVFDKARFVFVSFRVKERSFRKREREVVSRERERGVVSSESGKRNKTRERQEWKGQCWKENSHGNGNVGSGCHTGIDAICNYATVLNQSLHSIAMISPQQSTKKCTQKLVKNLWRTKAYLHSRQCHRTECLAC